MYTTNAKIVGMTCEACVKLAKRRLEKIKDVTEVNLELNGKMEIQSERNISKNEIKQTLEGTGYDVL